MMSTAAKSFDYNNLSVLHSNYNDPTRLFSELYLVKFLDKRPAKILDLSAKSFHVFSDLMRISFVSVSAMIPQTYCDYYRYF